MFYLFVDLFIDIFVPYSGTKDKQLIVKRMKLNFVNIADRVQYIINTRFNGNKRKFANSIGFVPQVISNIVAGRKSKPSFDVLKAIIETNSDISTHWFLTGKGEILNSNVSSDANVKKITDYKEKYIELLEENRKLSTDNIELQKKVFYLQGDNLNSDQPIAAEPNEFDSYPKK
ncbi:hypothetical protein CXF68_08845 [Tenacibaculum sp. Bg11-29]|nr:hypothetical protein CXF68_08845 [Tenacibaculum sp. Bg11-29]